MRRIGLTLTAFVLMSSYVSFATPFQNIYASLTGVVMDESGAVIPGVNITITNAGTGLTRTIVTDERGNYLVPLLPIGNYTISAELTGFRKELRTGIILQVDQTAREDFRLLVGEITEVLEVTAVAPLVKSETSSVGNVIDTTKVVELPLNGRDFKNLALLVPNAMPTAQGTTHSTRGGFNVAGTREIANNYMLDGVDNNDPTVNLFTLKPSIEIIQEFKVQTNSYSAESGRYSGGQINVTTKSGTNDLHGSLFEFLRDASVDAKNFFDKPGDPIPPFTRHQFGGSLGGPIAKDKTHFFVAYEGIRLRRSETLVASVPIPEFKKGDFSALLAPSNPWTKRTTQLVDPVTGRPFAGNIIPDERIHRISRQIAAKYPEANRAQDAIANFLSNPLSTNDIHQYTYRIDHQLTKSIRMFGRHTFSRDRLWDAYDHFHNPTKLPGWGRVEPTDTQHIVLSTTFILNPQFINELRLGHNRFKQSRSAIDKSDGVQILGIPIDDPRVHEGITRGWPLFNITGFDAVGSSSGQPQDRHDNTYQVVDNISYIRGTHSIKAGLDLLKFQEFEIGTPGRGRFDFNGQYTGFALADFLLGLPRQTERRLVAEVWGYPEHYAHGFYVQDDWKARPNLTVNIGVRYEMDRPMREVYNRMARFDPVRNLLLLPRTNDPRFAPSGPLLKPLIDRYYPSVKTPIVVGDKDTVWNTDYNNFAPRLGLAWRPFNNNTTVVRAGYGIFYDVMLVGNDYQSFTHGAAPFKYTQTFTADLRVPNITMDNPFPENFVLPELSPNAIADKYQMPYSQQMNLGIEREITPNLLVEIGYVGNTGIRLAHRRNINQAIPGPGPVQSRRPYPWFGNINFREQSGRSAYHSMQLRVEKRYSAGSSLLMAYTFGKSIDNDSQSEGAGGAGVQNHYDWKTNNKGLSSFDVRQRLAFSYVYELPFGPRRRFGSNWPAAARYVLGGWEVAGIVSLQSGRPITVTYSGDWSGTGQLADRPNLIGKASLPRGERSITRWFNTDAFVMPARGQFGNAGRGLLTGPGLNNVDFSLKKDYRFHEHHNVQFRAEFFNFFNHPNFEYPNRSINSSQFGRIFGATESRQIQFGLRYSF